MNTNRFCYRRYTGIDKYRFIGRCIYAFMLAIDIGVHIVYRYFLPTNEPIYQLLKLNNTYRFFGDIMIASALFVFVDYIFNQWLEYHSVCKDLCCCNKWFCYRRAEGFERHIYIGFIAYCMTELTKHFLDISANYWILNRYIMVEIVFRGAMFCSAYYFIYRNIIKSWIGSHYGCTASRCQYQHYTQHRDED